MQKSFSILYQIRIVPVTLFGFFEIRPFWGAQDPDDEFLNESITLQLFGMIISFWGILIWLSAIFSKSILKLLQESNFMVNLLTNFFVNVLIAILVSITLLYLLSKYSSYIDEKAIDKLSEFQRDLQSIFADADSPEIEGKFSKEIALIFVAEITFGLLSGIFFAILFFIPFYLLFLFFTFFLSAVFSFNTINFLISAIISWIIHFRWVLNWRLRIKETEHITQIKTDYDITMRNLDIVASNKEPIVCPACKSFVAGNLSECPVCSESLDISDSLGKF